MSFKYHKPTTKGPTDMFLWWCKEKTREKRHLRLKYKTSHARDTILVSKSSDEIAWLKDHIKVYSEKADTMLAEEKAKNKKRMSKRMEDAYEMRWDVMESTRRLKALEKLDKPTEEVIMSERTFRDILYTFNKKTVEALINGEVINMKNRMGFLYVQCIPRFHPKFRMNGSNQINWGESNKYKKELIEQGIQPRDKDHPDGKEWLIYYTDDHFLKFAWSKKKGACRVKNHNFYAFYPSHDDNGPRRQLVDANRENELLYKSYVNRKIYYPRLKETA